MSKLKSDLSAEILADIRDLMSASIGVPYVHQKNYDYTAVAEFVWPPSQTDPSHHMSVSDLLDKYTRNIAVPMVKTVNVDTDVSMFDGLDRIDRMQVAMNMRKANEAARQKITDDLAAIKKKRDEEKFENAVNKRADELAKMQNALHQKGVE
jgi:Mg/Co/Ni transporter MgtE